MGEGGGLGCGRLRVGGQRYRAYGGRPVQCPAAGSPHPTLQVTEGIPIEYLRHYRSGGYDFGTLAEESEAAVGGPGFGHPGSTRGPGS